MSRNLFEYRLCVDHLKLLIRTKSKHFSFTFFFNLTYSNVIIVYDKFTIILIENNLAYFQNACLFGNLFTVFNFCDIV